ncbi:MAG: 2OG-Fe(II) oxygenase [Bacteroidetes bacterium]|nr:MAG: 2OG-Fe(II) oxygenase [Bacteroidota bacterium]
MNISSQNILQHTENIWTIENFITPEECEQLIFFSENIGYKEAEISLNSGAKMMKNIRNNERLLYKDENLAKNYWLTLKNYCPQTIDNYQAIGLNEQFRFYKYEINQRFKRHIDGRFIRNENEESRITFMIYLNDDFEGGETTFDEIKIKPKIGNALCFIHEQKHEGSPVITGIKYVLRSDVMYQKI